ncbi:MAG: hypothetical protein ACOYOA_10185 [Saprospiraceae bacterium]
MKKFTIFTLLLFSVFSRSFAQVWLEAGLKGFVGTTVPFNKNNFNDDLSSFKLSPDFAYGGKLAINFGENNGVTIDGLIAQTKAKYQYDVLGKVEGEHTLAWRNIDIYPMYRHYYERSFIEIGPKLSLLSSMKSTNVNGIDVDRKDNFNGFNYGASFGFGGFLVGSDFFSLSFNCRIDYQISDFISEQGKTANYMIPFRSYNDYATTNPITARVGLELSIPIGGVAQANCGRRVFFMGGNR